MKASGVFLLALVLCSALLTVNAAASDEHAATGLRKLLSSKTFGLGLGLGGLSWGGSRYSGFGYGTRGGWNNYGSYGSYGSPYGYGGYDGYYGRGGYGGYGYGRGSGYGYGRRYGYGRGWGKK